MNFDDLLTRPMQHPPCKATLQRTGRWAIIDRFFAWHVKHDCMKQSPLGGHLEHHVCRCGVAWQ